MAERIIVKSLTGPDFGIIELIEIRPLPPLATVPLARVTSRVFLCWAPLPPCLRIERHAVDPHAVQDDS
jgi:hypothetical protein